VSITSIEARLAKAQGKLRVDNRDGDYWPVEAELVLDDVSLLLAVVKAAKAPHNTYDGRPVLPGDSYRVAVVNADWLDNLAAALAELEVME
jgi:hypothetical protein